jgi:hypothetical protein
MPSRPSCNAILVILLVAGASLAARSVRAEASCAAVAASPEAKANCALQPGALAEARLSDFRPTQPSLGFDELHYRLGRFEFGKDKINKRFDDWCESSGLVSAVSAAPDAKLRDQSTFTCKLAKGAETKDSIEPMKTAVVGPGGQLYLTDGHHTFTSFMETPDGGADTLVRVRITHNFGDLGEAAFWEAMQKNALVWLRDAAGNKISPADLPKSLGMKNFGNDQYRSVLYFGRDVGYKQLSDNAAFQEFYIGDWLRNHPTIKLANYNIKDFDGYLALLKDATQAFSALPDDAIVAEGRTAKSLGRLAPWNAAEFTKVSMPYSEPKPGKVSYAFKYKAAHGL